LEEVNRDITKRLRVNREIRAEEIRLVGKKGEQLGIMSVPQALEIAKKDDLDLVEVAPIAVPPVCRLLDYGKYKYEQARKERELRKSQKVSLLREVRLRPKIGNHDFEAKARSVMFRGREITHPEIGLRLLQRMVESQKETASIDRQPSMVARRMTLILSPLTGQKTTVKEETKKESKNA
jgi:translation initiation factor IF-3